jgi:serine/threonine protein kinase
MELMYGDLKKLGLASRQLLVAVDTMLQIAEGMKYLHEQDIVHGDLNATNILINRVPIPEMEEAGYVQAKVAGFGVFGEPRTGRAGWMAPELFEEQNPQPNQEQFMASDIYSYAVTCFEILTSKSPFAEAENQADVRAAVKEGKRPHLPDSLPTSLRSLIRRCWDADASNRPSFSEICAELRQCKCDLMLNGHATLMERYVQASFTTYSKGYQLSHVTMNSQTKLFSVLVVKFHGHIIHACILHVVLFFLIMFFSNFANTNDPLINMSLDCFVNVNLLKEPKVLKLYQKKFD